MTNARPSLSRRLTVSAIAWLFLCLAVGGWSLNWAFRTTLEDQFGHRLETLLRALISAIDVDANGKILQIRPIGDPHFDQIYSGWYWEVAERDGRQFRSRSLWDQVIPVTENDTTITVRRINGPNGESLMVTERDLHFADSAATVHVLVGGNLNEMRDEAQRFQLILLIALGGLGTGLTLAILIQVRFGLSPLRAMADDLTRVRQGHLARLPEHYPHEVAPLADAVNKVLDKDDRLIERARTHVGNLAHALKTPLAVIAAENSVPVSKPLIAEQVRLMTELIEHHLNRASAAASIEKETKQTINVAEVGAALISVMKRLFADKNLTFHLTIPDALIYRGQREDLEEIVGNLLENACKWARTEINICAEMDDGGVLLTIEDDGPGLTDDQRTQISQRGKRLDENTPGWGLGLSIISDLIDLNGGQLSFERSKLGGLQVNARLSTTKGL